MFNSIKPILNLHLRNPLVKLSYCNMQLKKHTFFSPKIEDKPREKKKNSPRTQALIL